MRIVLAFVVLAILAILVFVALEFDKVDNAPTTETATVETTTDEASAGTEQATGSGETAAVDEAGGTGESSDVSTQTAGDEGAASESEPAAQEGTVPSFDIVRLEKTGEAVMAGRAAPFAIVEIYDHDQLVASTQADEKGDWVIVLDQPLSPGSHELRLEAKDDEGGTSVPSEQSVVMLVPEPDDTEGSASVSVTSGTEQVASAEEGGGTSGEAIAVLVPQDEGGQVEVLQGPTEGIGIAGGDGLSLDTLDYNEAGDVTLSGRAKPDAEVRAYVDGALAGRAQADSSGAWVMTLDQPVDLGLHDLRVDQVDDKGQVLSRLETPFDRGSLQLPESAEPLVIIQPGNNLWTIARHTYGSGFQYTQIFQANKNQIADPDLIYPGQIFILPEIN